MDANADHNDEMFSKFLEDCQLLDLHDDPTGQLPPKTYFRGTRKLDYILGSLNIAQSVSRAGILAYSDGLKFSDHRALFIDVKETSLFTDRGADPTSHKSRGLHMSNKKQANEYCQLLKQKLETHNVFQRCRNLQETAKDCGISELKTQADSIDLQITSAALKAEKQCSNKHMATPGPPNWLMRGNASPFGVIVSI